MKIFQSLLSSRSEHSIQQSKMSNGDLKPFTNSNEYLNMLCPVSLHEKLAFKKHRIDECRCRRLSHIKPPTIRDVEFDYFVKLLPPEQLIVVAIEDSM